MTLQVVFQQPAFSVNAPLSGHARASEAVAAGASARHGIGPGNTLGIVVNVGDKFAAASS